MILGYHQYYDNNNMNLFIAIPVSVGDAFYLNRNNYSILVDGGHDEAGFPGLFQTTTQSDKVNILVCTHNDADHANGILGFLKSSLSCDEVWLPGSWLGVLPGILKPLDEVIAELGQNILSDKRQQETSDLYPEIHSLEEYCSSKMNLSDQKIDQSELSDLGDDGWPEPLIDTLEMSYPWHPTSFQYWIFELRWLFVIPRLDPAEFQLLWSAIDAASRIRAIALEAFNRGIPIRWFDYDTNHPSGGNNYLQPLNAKEIAKVRPAVGTLLDLLSLSVSNKESLVFWSPPTEDSRGVLFNADSDLANVKIPTNHDLRGALATAPHHGSEANAKAYSEIAKANPTAYGSMIWIRSDSRSKKRPGASYLSLGSSMRSCTICRLSGKQFTTKHAVVLLTVAGLWKMLGVTCKCK